MRYKEADKAVRKEIKAAKDKWIQDQCDKIQSEFESNNLSTAFKSVKELTSQPVGASSVIKTKNGEVLTDTNDNQERWTEYAEELYNYDIKINL